MASQVYVWLGDEQELQHATAQPEDEVEREWHGATACGLSGSLRWIPPELVDPGSACPGCLTAAGTAPALGGASMGPP